MRLPCSTLPGEAACAGAVASKVETSGGGDAQRGANYAGFMAAQFTFPAFRIHETGARLETLTLDDLSPGEVVIRVHWSGINYKDALAATGAGRIVRRFPLVGGVDLSGVVESSSDASLKPGDPGAGHGLRSVRDARRWLRRSSRACRLEAVVKLPAALSLRDAMAIGTAGFAAALAITQLEHNGLKPGHRCRWP